MMNPRKSAYQKKRTDGGLHEFRPVGLAHVTLVLEYLMHAQSGREAVRRVALLRNLHVVPENLLVVRVSAVLYDGLRTLHRTLAAQVSYALLGDDDTYGMLTVVHV